MRSKLDFSAIRAHVQFTSAVSRFRRAQTKIVVVRSIIVRNIAETNIAKCRNTYARTCEWLVGSNIAPENLEQNTQSLEQQLKSADIS